MCSLWTIAHWSDLAQQDRNKMADWCHGERSMGGDRSLRGLMVSEAGAVMETSALPHPPNGTAL